MKALFIIAAVLILLALIPLGVQVRYDTRGPWAVLLAGPIKIRLLPSKKKKKGKEKKKDKPKEKPKSDDKPKEKKPIGGLIRDFYPFVQLGFRFLGCFFRKLRVPILTLHVSFGGSEDAAKAAIRYGEAWGVIGSIMPPLRRQLRIRKENVSASCDFTTDEMRVYAELKAFCFLGDLIAMLVRYGLRGLKLYLNMKKRNRQQTVSDKAVQNNESSST